jgi:hypothetical protein
MPEEENTKFLLFSLEKAALVYIYKTLIRSVMDYACVLLAACVLLETLERNVSRKAAREMAHVNPIEQRHTMIMRAP